MENPVKKIELLLNSLNIKEYISMEEKMETFENFKTKLILNGILFIPLSTGFLSTIAPALSIIGLISHSFLVACCLFVFYKIRESSSIIDKKSFENKMEEKYQNMIDQIDPNFIYTFFQHLDDASILLQNKDKFKKLKKKISKHLVTNYKEKILYHLMNFQTEKLDDLDNQIQILIAKSEFKNQNSLYINEEMEMEMEVGGTSKSRFQTMI